MNYTPSARALEGLSEQRATQMKGVTEQLGAALAGELRTLVALEQTVRHAVKTLGNGLLAGLCSVYVPQYVEPSQRCTGGGVATYQRLRAGTTQTVLGAVTLKRPYYLCASCHQGGCP